MRTFRLITRTTGFGSVFWLPVCKSQRLAQYCCDQMLLPVLCFASVSIITFCLFLKYYTRIPHLKSVYLAWLVHRIILRGLMQHYLEESSKREKASSCQGCNGSNQGGMEKCLKSLICWDSSTSLVNKLGYSNHIILLGRVNQLIAVDIKKLGMWERL